MNGTPMRYASVLVVFLGVLWQATAVGQEKRPLGDMIKTAGAVVAVEILETDYTATPADGPMIAVARTLKSLRGPLTTGQQFRFTETAWVGPTYRKGENRILFLERSISPEAPRASQWRILSHLYAKDDFFIEPDSIPDLSLESLELFLKNIDFPLIRPQGVIFRKSTAK